MLRYRADIRTLGIIAAYWVLFTMGWALQPHGWYAAALVALTCVSSWLCAVVAHNTVHTPVFKRRWMNRVFQVVLSLSYGFPISEYLPGHNLSHHKFTQRREDVMRTTKMKFRWNLLNILVFFFVVGPAVTEGNYRYKKVMKDKNPGWNRQLFYELVAVWGVKAALLILNWRLALLYTFIPHFYAVWGITTVNYLQHDGCDPDHPQNHSRNFVSPAFNWFTVNNGFHGMHHEVPGMHWSLLPEAHKTHLAGIDPRLEQKSLMVYLIKTFVYPGKRVTYDGKPVAIPGEGPDRDWVKAMKMNELVEADQS